MVPPQEIEVADIIQEPIIAVEVEDPSLDHESVVVEEHVNVEA